MWLFNEIVDGGGFAPGGVPPYIPGELWQMSESEYKCHCGSFNS